MDAGVVKLPDAGLVVIVAASGSDVAVMISRVPPNMVPQPERVGKSTARSNRVTMRERKERTISEPP